MNIFVLSKDPKQAAQYHNDKHVVKMILETAQILSTVLHENGYSGDDIYKPTHKNHPCVNWAGESRSNFIWLCELGLELSQEYTHRYGKYHKSSRIVSQCLYYSVLVPDGVMSEFAQVMPREYKDEDPVKAYRQYYLNEKHNLASWKNRDKPDWWTTN